jgi:hydrogenase maturation protease
MLEDIWKMDSHTNRIVVVGCGDRFASDEVAGLEVAAELRRTSGHICEVRAIELCSPTFLAELSPDTIVIFVDGVRSGARPGTIHAIRLPSERVHAHGQTAGSGDALDVHREIDMLQHVKGPKMYLLGIEIERWDPGIGVTTSVHAAVMEVVRELAKLNGKGQPKLPFFTEDLRSD